MPPFAPQFKALIGAYSAAALAGFSGTGGSAGAGAASAVSTGGASVTAATGSTSAGVGLGGRRGFGSRLRRSTAICGADSGSASGLSKHALGFGDGLLALGHAFLDVRC